MNHQLDPQCDKVLSTRLALTISIRMYCYTSVAVPTVYK